MNQIRSNDEDMGSFRPHKLAAGAAILTALSLAGCLAPPHRAQGGVPVTPETPVDAAQPKPQAESGPEIAERVASVVEAHSREREEAGLPPVRANARLQAAAQAHARDMAEHEKMDHKGSDGSTPFRRMETQGYRYRRAGENIAYGQPDVEAVMKVWMNSPPHKKNILGGFSQIGVGYATAEDGTPYWCVTFGFPLRR